MKSPSLRPKIKWCKARSSSSWNPCMSHCSAHALTAFVPDEAATRRSKQFFCAERQRGL